MARVLGQLGMQVGATGPTWQVVAPAWRFDIAIEEDLIEEIARIYGFDRVHEANPTVRQPLRALTETRVPAEVIADTLVQRGYWEGITYSFVDPALLAVFCPGEPSLALANPIAADLATMRTSLWPGLAKVLGENQRRQQSRVRLFEVGRKYLVEGNELHEVPVVAGIAAGPALPEQWGAKPVAVDFFDVKADVEALLRTTGSLDRFRFVAAGHPALHPGQSARIVRGDRPVGWVGRLHPEVEARLELTYSALVFELEIDAGLAADVPAHREISRFPAVRRDLAMIVDEAVSVQTLLDCVRKSAGTLLTDLVVFDVYRGAGITPGCKSVAIGLNLQDISRTLTDEEIDAVVARVVADLEREQGATIRDK
jgi:phenylalanyl-tRNA synthetase beta chain